MNDLMPVPLPDGIEAHEIVQMDLNNLEELARADPEEAMIRLDYFMMHQAKSQRDAWVHQAIAVYFVYKRELWRNHPEGYTSIFQWCDKPEINIAAGVVSDMINVVKLAPKLQAECDEDVFDLVREVGSSKVRAILPYLREASESDTLDVLGPDLIATARSSSLKQVQALMKPAGIRMQFNPVAMYRDNGNDTHNVAFLNLTFDQLDLICGKLGIKMWQDEHGRPIASPLGDNL